MNWEKWSESTHGKYQGYLRIAITKKITELRGFIGICTYYKKFVKGFSKLTSPLNNFTNKDCIYVVVDILNTFSHIFFVTSSFSAAQVAKHFFKQIFRLHGLPKSMVSDREGRFMSAFLARNFQICGNSVQSK